MATSTKESMANAWNMVVFTLVVIGIGGLSWSTFKDGGWLEKVSGAVWDAQVRHPMLIVPIILGTLFTAWVFLRGGLKPGKPGPFGKLFIYGLMASGVYHLYTWLLG